MMGSQSNEAGRVALELARQLGCRGECSVGNKLQASEDVHNSFCAHVARALKQLIGGH